MPGLPPRGPLFACLLVSALPSFASPPDPMDPLWMPEAESSTEATGITPILAADPSPHPLDPFWVPMTFPGFSRRGTLFGTAEYSGQLVVTGRFGAIGAQRAQRGLTWDGSQFGDLGLSRLAWGFAAVDWDGDLVAAGQSVQTGVRETVFRRTGAEWESLATTNGAVRALAVFEGDLVAAGDFTLIGGVAANRVARFDGTSWQPMGAGLASGVFVHDLMSHGGYLYVAALFGGTSPIKGIGRWDGSTWATVGPGLHSAPNAGSETHQLATDGTDVYVAGGFSLAGTETVWGVARWDGASWHAVSTRNNTASAIAWWNGALYSNLTTGPDRVSRLSGGEWIGTGDGLPANVPRLGVAGGKLAAIGNFGPAVDAGEVSSIHLFDGTGWTKLGSSGGPGMTGLDNIAYSATVAKDRLFVSGEFTNAGNTASGLRVNGVGAWDGASWSPLQNGAGVGFQPVHLETVAGDVIMGGNFFISSQVRNIARWDGTTWSGYGFDVNQLAAYTWAAAEFLGQLHAGGEFVSTGGSRLVRWNGSSWESVGGGVGVGSNMSVYALQTWNGGLVAAGRFANAGGAPASNIASWDGSSWQTLGTGLDGECDALAVLGTDLVAGGLFTLAGGQSTPGAARWDGVAWHPMGIRAVSIRDLTTVDGVLYAGGVFLGLDDTPTATVARWTGTEWETMGSGGAPTTTRIHWVEGYHGDLYVGGDFSHLMGTVTAEITRLPTVNAVAVGDRPATTDVRFAAAPNPGRALTSFSFSLPATGRVRLRVFDATGRLVTTLVDGEVLAGRHTVPWRAAARPGVYFAQLEAPGGARHGTRVVRLDP
jgi:trimeric autotransporter adhesin